MSKLVLAMAIIRKVSRSIKIKRMAVSCRTLLVRQPKNILAGVKFSNFLIRGHCPLTKLFKMYDISTKYANLTCTVETLGRPKLL